MTEINWSRVHNASELLLKRCRELLKKPNGTGCSYEELIEALNNVRGQLETEKRK